MVVVATAGEVAGGGWDSGSKDTGLWSDTLQLALYGKARRCSVYLPLEPTESVVTTRLQIF